MKRPDRSRIRSGCTSRAAAPDTYPQPADDFRTSRAAPEIVSDRCAARTPEVQNGSRRSEGTATGGRREAGEPRDCHHRASRTSAHLLERFPKLRVAHTYNSSFQQQPQVSNYNLRLANLFFTSNSKLNFKNQHRLSSSAYTFKIPMWNSHVHFQTSTFNFNIETSKSDYTRNCEIQVSMYSCQLQFSNL